MSGLIPRPTDRPRAWGINSKSASGFQATIYGFCKGQCIPSTLYNLSYYMCYLNSSGNPFAYALANRQFRSAFLRMLRGNFRRVY